MYATIRLDETSDSDRIRLVELFKSLKVKVVIYEEIAIVTKKVHFQGYCECTRETYEIYKKAFLKEFTSTHTRFQRSFTVVRKVVEYMIYVAKDKNLLYQEGFTEEHIKENESKSYQKKKLAIGQEIIHKAREHFKGRKPTELVEVVEFVTHYFGGKLKCFDMPYIKKYSYLVCYHLLGDKYVHHFAKSVSETMNIEMNLLSYQE